MEFGGPCKIPAKIGAPLELVFSSKLLKMKMGACLRASTGVALRGALLDNYKIAINIKKKCTRVHLSVSLEMTGKRAGGGATQRREAASAASQWQQTREQRLQSLELV